MRRDKERIFDEYLASAARAGDAKAFTRLAQRWQPRLLAHAYRLTGDQEMARDICQDGWIDIVRNIGRLEDVVAFPAWAFRIISRRTADTIRKRQRQRKLSAAVASDPIASNGQTTLNETGAEACGLAKAIAQLPAAQRAAIALFYSYDLSITEISVALDVPAGTVKTRLMTARKSLRSLLEGVEENG